jgi:hypothetical protein
MSEEALQRSLDRISSGDGFRQQVQRDPNAAREGFELSPVEQLALASRDEHALTRLAGLDVSGYLAPAS